MISMPSQKRSRHTLLALRPTDGGKVVIALMALTRSSRQPSRIQSLTIDGQTDEVASGEIKTFLSALGGSALCHFDQPEIVEIVNLAISKAGKLPVDNPVIDLNNLASTGLNRRGQNHSMITLLDLAARQGISQQAAQSAQFDAHAAVDLLSLLFKPLFHPEINRQGFEYAARIFDHRFRMSPDDIALLADNPAPAPDIPDLVAPVDIGWRRGEWDCDEALETALRFRNGADLTALSRLTRRSPRAIRARLIFDGICTRT